MEVQGVFRVERPPVPFPVEIAGLEQPAQAVREDHVCPLARFQVQDRYARVSRTVDAAADHGIGAAALSCGEAIRYRAAKRADAGNDEARRAD